MAPAGPSPPRPAAGDTGPASHPGPGGGVTATAEEHPLLVGGLRLRRARSAWTRRSGPRSKAREARPLERRSRAPYRGHRAHSARPDALAHAHCAARTLPIPRRGFGRGAVGLSGWRGAVADVGSSGSFLGSSLQGPAFNIKMISVE